MHAKGCIIDRVEKIYAPHDLASNHRNGPLKLYHWIRHLESSVSRRRFFSQTSPTSESFKRALICDRVPTTDGTGGFEQVSDSDLKNCDEWLQGLYKLSYPYGRILHPLHWLGIVDATTSAISGFVAWARQFMERGYSSRTWTSQILFWFMLFVCLCLLMSMKAALFCWDHAQRLTGNRLGRLLNRASTPLLEMMLTAWMESSRNSLQLAFNSYGTAFDTWSAGRRFCLTQGGGMGWVSQAACEGDPIVRLVGCNIPFVLRQRESGSFQVIGDAYLHGAMHDRLAMATDTGERELVIT